MSTLKVNKIRDTAGSADSITLDPNGGAVLAGVTTVSTVKVGSGVTILQTEIYFILVYVLQLHLLVTLRV